MGVDNQVLRGMYTSPPPYQQKSTIIKILIKGPVQFYSPSTYHDTKSGCSRHDRGWPVGQTLKGHRGFGPLLKGALIEPPFSSRVYVRVVGNHSLEFVSVSSRSCVQKVSSYHTTVTWVTPNP